MKLCKNFNELKIELNQKIENAMKSEVADIIKETMQSHIATDVYAVYEPQMYDRRFGKDGLISDNNIISIFDSNSNTLITQNITVGNSNYSPSDNYIAPIIENGKGYHYPFPFFNIPRPFIHNTYEELVDAQWAKKALQVGLQRQGLNAK